MVATPFHRTSRRRASISSLDTQQRPDRSVSCP